METVCSWLDAILLDFLKIRKEISVSVHILRFWFLKSFSSEALLLRAYTVNSCVAQIAELRKQFCFELSCVTSSAVLFHCHSVA